MRASAGISVPLRPDGIAGAVHALVVIAHDRDQRVARREAREDARPGLGVLAHERPLLVAQGVGLEQQADRQRELADVVDERAELDAGCAVAIGSEAQGYVARVQRDDGRVLGGLRIEGGERAHQGDARGEGSAVDSSRRAAARQGVRRNLLKEVRFSWRGTQSRRIAHHPPQTCVRHARSNPCETDGGRCEHRPPASVLVRLRYQPCPRASIRRSFRFPGNHPRPPGRRRSDHRQGVCIAWGPSAQAVRTRTNTSLLNRYTRAEHQCDMAANSGKTQRGDTDPTGVRRSPARHPRPPSARGGSSEFRYFPL